MDGIRTEHIHTLLPDHVTEQYTQHRKVTSGRDGIFTSADVVIALELADATFRFAFRIAVSGKYMPEADIDENGYVNALRCTHDHASGGWDAAADVTTTAASHCPGALAILQAATGAIDL